MPATLLGRKLDGAYAFINWFLDGWAGADLNRQGYYSAVLDTAKEKMEPYAWAYWMEGKPAAKDIKSPGGDLLAKAGSVREGGSYEARMGALRAGTRSWTKTTTWSRNGISLSPPNADATTMGPARQRDLPPSLHVISL